MKTLLGIVSAALLLSPSGASAGTSNITISLLGFGCTVAITTLSDADNGVGGKDLLVGNSSGCGFVGGGTIGKLKNVDGNTALQATLAGTADVLPGYRFLVLLDYPFVSGGTYRAYETSDGKKLTFLSSGTYKVGS